jgi:hypothetical protein
MKMQITKLSASWCNKFGEGGRGLSKNYNKGMLVLRLKTRNAIELSSSFGICNCNFDL